MSLIWRMVLGALVGVLFTWGFGAYNESLPKPMSAKLVNVIFIIVTIGIVYWTFYPLFGLPAPAPVAL